MALAQRLSLPVSTLVETGDSSFRSRCRSDQDSSTTVGRGRSVGVRNSAERCGTGCSAQKTQQRRGDSTRAELLNGFLGNRESRLGVPHVPHATSLWRVLLCCLGFWWGLAVEHCVPQRSACSAFTPPPRGTRCSRGRGRSGRWPALRRRPGRTRVRPTCGRDRAPEALAVSWDRDHAARSRCVLRSG